MPYEPRHEWQYAAANTARTRTSGCTWVSGAIGLDASTGGRLDPPPDAVVSKVLRSEETNPDTPGWSLADLRLAVQRLGGRFDVRSGAGWAGVRAARELGLFVVLQGDSDRFPGGCSGAFDGDHAIGLPPGPMDDATWAIHDPICRDRTRQAESVLRAYAEKLSPGVLFGVFPDPVPGGYSVDVYSVPGLVVANAPAGTPYYADPEGGTELGRTAVERTYVLVGQSAPVGPGRYLVDGQGDEPSGRMRWIPASSLTGRQDVTAARDAEWRAWLLAGSPGDR